MEPQLDIVTGAFGYSGSLIADSLINRGHRVRTLTGHPQNAPAQSPVEPHPLDFNDSAQLIKSMRGAHTLYNTYWVRFAHGNIDHEVAVRNSQTLFEAAARAGVQRIVHVSILHPTVDSPFPYFAGKARVEHALHELGVSHAIVRPAILFGGSGVLINNIAWLLRHLPVFAIGGKGTYRVRGIHVEDLAALCVQLGAGTENVTLDAVGPERPTFRELVETVRHAIGARSLIVPVPGPVLIGASGLLGIVLRDRVLTSEEYYTMAAGLADSTAESTGTTRFSEWVSDHAFELGRHYANELTRHY